VIAAAILALQTGKLDVEIVPPVFPGVVTVEAVMRLPRTGPRERAELAILADVLLDDTEEYGHRQLVNFTALSGQTVRCDLYPDALRVRYGVLESDSASVVPILANIVHDSELHEEAITASVEKLLFQRRDYWTSALEPEVLKYRQARVQDIGALYKTIGRPENLHITIAAPAALGDDLSERWRTAVGEWHVGANPAFAPDTDTPKPSGERRGKLTTILLRGKPVRPTDPDFPTNLLAIFALGGGKDSAVWKALREGLGWSYRQEALLRNSPDGLEPVVEVVTSHSDADIDRANQVRPALEKAVLAWTPADQAHAVASAEALFNRGIGLDPLYFKSTRPAGDDALFMRTYWRFKTGEDWNPKILLDAMANVEVKKLQAAATAILEGANIELIRGTG